jgi:hypothetical protein
VLHLPKTVRVAAAAVLLALGTVSSTFAGSASLIVPPGSRVCLNPITANSHVDAQGQATPGVRFTVVRGETQIYQTSDYTAGFGASFDRAYTPSYFPGSFKVCARNVGTKSANVSMSITGY